MTSLFFYINMLKILISREFEWQLMLWLILKPMSLTQTFRVLDLVHTLSRICLRSGCVPAHVALSCFWSRSSWKGVAEMMAHRSVLDLMPLESHHQLQLSLSLSFMAICVADRVGYEDDHTREVASDSCRAYQAILLWWQLLSCPAMISHMLDFADLLCFHRRREDWKADKSSDTG